MVAPVVVGSATTFAAASSGVGITLARPAGVLAGDMLVAVLRANSTDSAEDFALSGWTPRGRPFVPSDPGGRVLSILTRPVVNPATEPATYDFTKSTPDGRRAGAMFIVRGVDLSNPIAGESVAANADLSPVITINPFEVDTTDEALMVYAWGAEVVAPNATDPVSTPGTAVALVPSATGSSSTRTVLWVGHEVNADTTTIRPSLTWTSASGAIATAVVLRGLPEPELPGFPLKLGSGATALATVLVGGNRVTPLSVRSFMPGFDSVPQLLATPGATWAHRGGSAVFPEMTEFAYDQCVMLGYGALEFSAQRSSDGVWFGLHDNDFNTIMGATGTPAPSTLTWAQIAAAYEVRKNAGATPRPLYKLTDFLTKYTSHALIVDMKNAIGAHDTEFLDLLDAHGGPSRIVVKFSGVGGGAAALADKATARGYETWGYFYQADYVNGNLALWQSHWTLLGMAIDATTAWSAPGGVLSYGKPVVGHIAATQAAYDLAVTKGASMVQCSGATLVAPVSIRP